MHVAPSFPASQPARQAANGHHILHPSQVDFGELDIASFKQLWSPSRILLRDKLAFVLGAAQLWSVQPYMAGVCWLAGLRLRAAVALPAGSLCSRPRASVCCLACSICRRLCSLALAWHHHHPK
jgi:hypothetical protein